jgi:manganese transport protein
MVKNSLWKRILAFFGPAYLVAVGYMDPGNWATDIEGGSRYGYALIWVLVMSNIMAIILQTLSARLGIVYKKDLAQVNRETYPPVINFCLYILAELAIAACDLAEIIGMAIGLNLLFGLPMIWGVTITIFDTFLLLYLQRLGIRKMEAFIISLILIISVSFTFELFFVQPVLSDIVSGLKPSLPDDYALYIAIGIIGATVMPHNLYLHSALVQTRKIGDDDASKRKAIKWNFVDSFVALNLALFVNAAILILAASAFHNNGMTDISSIEDAHRLLEPLVGTKWASILFAVALIAAGQSSTVTGTLAGQIVMEGYLHIRINPWLRRILTRLIAILPAFITILIFGEEKMTDLLIFSQVVLSIQLSFAVIPLVYSVSNKRIMGNFVIKPWLIVLSVLVAAVILFLNIKMVLNTAILYISTTANLTGKVSVISGMVFFTIILLITIIYPLISNNRKRKESNIHQHYPTVNIPEPVNYHRIALALDFSALDSTIISHSFNQSNPATSFYLIHIVESAGAKYLGTNVADAESTKDMEQLNTYKDIFTAYNKEAKVCLGFGDRVKEISRICKEENVDLIIMGAHGHSGLMDFVYGQTIESVRHKVGVPVLIVS